jgi:hypothetical protein
MTTLMNIFLVVPAVSPKGKVSMEMYSGSGFAIVVFFAFLVILYLILSPDKPKKSEIRNK